MNNEEDPQIKRKMENGPDPDEVAKALRALSLQQQNEGRSHLQEGVPRTPPGIEAGAIYMIAPQPHPVPGAFYVIPGNVPVQPAYPMAPGSGNNSFPPPPSVGYCPIHGYRMHPAYGAPRAPMPRYESSTSYFRPPPARVNYPMSTPAPIYYSPQGSHYGVSSRVPPPAPAYHGPLNRHVPPPPAREYRPMRQYAPNYYPGGSSYGGPSRGSPAAREYHPLYYPSHAPGNRHGRPHQGNEPAPMYLIAPAAAQAVYHPQRSASPGDQEHQDDARPH